MASGSEILERQVAALKSELKSWEKQWSSANGGHKPGREDIKQDASISAKYREYDRLRRPTSFAKPVQTPPKERQTRPRSAHKRTALRERSGNALTATPNKVAKSAPLLEVVEEEEQEVEATPSFVRCALGPTPQKDGQVLGIFDMATTATPSKTLSMPTVSELPTISESPSKATAAPASSALALCATPQSSSKRRFLDVFISTPLKRKREDDGHTPSTKKRQFATPSFLRRSFPLAPIEEESGTAAPPFKKRGLVRSLSAIIQGLRKQEQNRMDDEWDIMDELEAEERGEVPRPAASKVMVEDSQVAEMPLGPDQGSGSDSDEASDPGALGADGKPRKVWKKKGLKRQTKRVKMRPVLHKAKKAAELEEREESDEEVVEETQLAGAPARTRQKQKHDRLGDGGGDSDNAGEDDAASNYDGEDAEAGAKPQKAGKPKAVSAKDKKAADDKSTAKPAKKVNTQAHANFRKLKIKNKNSKANGRGKRFGRR